MNITPLEVAEYFVVGNFIWNASWLAADLLSGSGMFKRYDEKSSLQKILNEESKKIGLNPKKISFKFPAYGLSDYTGGESGNLKSEREFLGIDKQLNDLNGDEFYIKVGEKLGKKSIIRHELAHIKNGDCDYKKPKSDFRYYQDMEGFNLYFNYYKLNFKRFLNYAYFKEPRAAFYGLTGWKIFLKNKN